MANLGTVGKNLAVIPAPGTLLGPPWWWNPVTRAATNLFAVGLQPAASGGGITIF